MEKLLKELSVVFSSVRFVAGSQCRWSPLDQTITYSADGPEEETVWALFHELAHATLDHTTYGVDIELLLMEVAAWEKAKQLAFTYGYNIDEDHIQDCLDTYRDWLDQRSTCPTCGNNSLQQEPEEYRCFNCQTIWHVSASRFCRPYRRRRPSDQKSAPNNSATKTAKIFD